ncbi:MAG: hypothetical protein AAF666_09405, partial [Pseudomonadota bacterium]
GIERLYMNKTNVEKLDALINLKNLKRLGLNETKVEDLEPIRNSHKLFRLGIEYSKVWSLNPLTYLPLEGLWFKGIPACKENPRLAEIAEIRDVFDRTQRTLGWLQSRDIDWAEAFDEPESTTRETTSSSLVALSEARERSNRSLERTSNFTGSDYRVRPDGSQMDEVPVAGPAAEITDPFKMRDQADRVSTLGDLASGLFADMKADQPNVPNSLRRDIGRFASEMKKDPEAVRPEFVHQMTSFFEFAVYDPDIRGALDKYDLNKLEDLCARAHALMARAYVARLEEILRAENEPLPPGTTLLGLEKALEDAIELTSGPVWTPFPALPPTLVEIMPQQVESAREQRLRLEIKPEAARTEGARQLAISNRPIWQPPRRPWGAGWNGRHRTRSSPGSPLWAASPAF